MRTIRAGSAVVAVVAGVVLAAGCAGDDPRPAPPDGDPTASSAAPGTPSAAPTQELTMGVLEGQNGALKPWWTGSSVQAEVPAGADAHDKYRSEFFWNTPNGDRLRVGEGDRLQCSLRVTPHLGKSGQDRAVWQVVWQLHGPNVDDTWSPPPLNLHVRGGSWRIGGGAGRDGGREAYAKPFQEFVDGLGVTWDLDVLVSQDPKLARVDAWLDGRHVVRDWHPPSGTRYPTHAWLTMKSGLYTGTDDDTAPTARRYVTFEPLRCAVTRAAPEPAENASTRPAAPHTTPGRKGTAEAGSAS